MELGATAYVILGILGLGPHSGYDIKQLADVSTRHFWATSYGQIYPELKRLTEAGLIKPKDASKGTRQRTLYSLTPKGQQTLHEWVSSPAIQTLEIRDDDGLSQILRGDGITDGSEEAAVIGWILQQYIDGGSHAARRSRGRPGARRGGRHHSGCRPRRPED